MEESTARKLRFGALQVVGAVAVIHLVVGVAELARLGRAGLLGQYFAGEQALSQPEPWLFTLAGLAILAGILATATGAIDYRRAYVLGIGVMVVFVVGWLAWHSVLGHGLSGAGEVTATDHSHGGLGEVVSSHYIDPLVGIFTGADQPGQVTLAVVSKTLEIVAAVLLGVLLALDPRVDDPDNPIAGMGENADNAESD